MPVSRSCASSLLRLLRSLICRSRGLSKGRFAQSGLAVTKVTNRMRKVGFILLPVSFVLFTTSVSSRVIVLLSGSTPTPMTRIPGLSPMCHAYLTRFDHRLRPPPSVLSFPSLPFPSLPSSLLQSPFTPAP